MSLFKSKPPTTVINTTFVNDHEKSEGRLNGARALIGYALDSFECIVDDLLDGADAAEDVAADASAHIDTYLRREAEALAEADRARVVAARIRALIQVRA